MSDVTSPVRKDTLPPPDDAFWKGIRRDQFYLEPEIAFLQGGSVGPSPKPVVDRVTEAIRAFDSDPLKHQQQYWPIVEESREKLAKFVGTRPERIALVQNTTMALSVFAQGVTWKVGGEILMTDQEYGAVNACFDYIAERHGLTVRRVHLPMEITDQQQIIDVFRDGMNEKNSGRGLRPRVLVDRPGDAGEGTDRNRPGERGIWVVVDGAHAVSMVPLRLDEWNPHFYASSLHKWTLSPKGTGMLFVSDDAHDRVEPLILGSSAHPNPNASRFDMMGTRDQTPFIGLGTALDFQQEIGWDHIRTYCRGLVDYMRERLGRIRGRALSDAAGSRDVGFYHDVHHRRRRSPEDPAGIVGRREDRDRGLSRQRRARVPYFHPLLQQQGGNRPHGPGHRAAAVGKGRTK